MSEEKRHIIIIGNGIAGITAARHIRKLSRHSITVISSESDYFFARTALMYVYMGHLRWQDIQPYENWFWQKNKIDLLKAYVTSIDPNRKTIETASGHTLSYDQLIIATGSSPRQLDIEGTNLDGVSPLHSMQDLDYMHKKSQNLRRGVIIGGGLIGIELAEMFHSRNIEVTHLVRENGYGASTLSPEESSIINQEIKNHGIDLHLNTEVSKITGDADGKVTSVTSKSGLEIACQFVGIAIGVQPNIKWLSTSGIELNKGILVDDYLQTNLPDVFAIGDCAELKTPTPGRKAIEPIWYTGKKMGETVAHTICRSKTKYDPGLWYNSAKFFTIEYQAYGNIANDSSGGDSIFLWQHPDGNKSIRLHYTANGITGFSVLGIRFRQAVCHQWIRLKTPLQEVLADLELAIFDAEFARPIGDLVREHYHTETGETIIQKGGSVYDRVFTFLKKAKSLSA